MFELSSTLEEAAIAVANEMLENNIQECKLPEMPSFLLARTKKSPDGYVFLGEMNVDGFIFYIFQMFQAMETSMAFFFCQMKKDSWLHGPFFRSYTNLLCCYFMVHH